MSERDMRADLRKAGRLDYALNDFDWSMLLPPDASIETFRLPIAEINPGVWDKPYEALCGQIDFNPFAYDVGCLGIELAYTFQVSRFSFLFASLADWLPTQHLCSSTPLLAPLLDGMVTPHVTDRFTAQEALSFLDEVQSEMTQDQLAEHAARRGSGPTIRYYKYDRWSNIPASLVKKWERYRNRPLSYFAVSIILPLCSRPWGASLVYRTRVILRWALIICGFPLRVAGTVSSLR